MRILINTLGHGEFTIFIFFHFSKVGISINQI